MGRRKLKGTAKFERMFRIWHYLRRYTDSENPTTQAEMRKNEEVSGYLGNKETFNRLIKDMAQALNSNEHGYKEEGQWKICFDDFKKYYGNNPEECDNEEDSDNFYGSTMHIKGLYYNRTFSYDEINMLIQGVLSDRTTDTKTAQQLIEKIEENLTTVYYEQGAKGIFKVQEPQLVDRALLKKNLTTIQEAIDKDVQVSFRFNGYTYRKELKPVRTVKDFVSPYYIVASGGRYYLLACNEPLHKGNIIKNMSIWRIDLMTDISIECGDKESGVPHKPRTPKNEVAGLPQQWSEDFQLKHLNMSYDPPVWITLRVKSEKEKDDPDVRIRPDYTFIHDWFGHSFKYVKKESEPPYDDIVKVECSPFAMANWAMQYSERVEVLEPLSVRNAVIEKIKMMNKKYNLK